MKPTYILPLADSSAKLENVGGKGMSLAKLARAGLPVPGGFHITTEAYRHYVAANNLQTGIIEALQNLDASDPATLESASVTIGKRFAQSEIPAELAEAIVQAYAALLGTNPAVAVRSSATAEDLPEASFAGQQETYLNISGANELLEATKKCWASLWTARAIGYRARQGISSEGVALAVVVQLLVDADAAGILFTANPVTGSRDQAIISAAWGLGEAVVGGVVTPDMLTVEKATGQLLEQHIADKHIMTVRVSGGTEEHPVPDELRQAAVLTRQQAAELVRLGVQIEALYGMPMDIEWALTAGEFAIVQARPITALPEPVVPASVEWKLPPGAYIAMRNNIVELMAEPLSPLFGTLGVQAVNASMDRLLTSFFGKPGIMPEELIITVNEYAYYNGSMSARQMAQIFLRSIGIARRMFKGAVARWVDVGHPDYLATVAAWQERPWPTYAATDILAGVRELAEAAIDAYGALVSGVIPAAWISEGIFTAVYRLLVKRRSDPPAPTFLMGFDSLPIRAEKALYDLAGWVRLQPDLADYLLKTATPQLTAQLDAGSPPPTVKPGDWTAWQQRIRTYLQQYGHTIYNLDFANPVPADDPTPILETCKLFIGAQGVNPHTRQQAAADRRERAVQTVMARLGPVRRPLFRKAVATAQRYAPLREDGLSDVGLAYPLLRKMLHEIGRCFVAAGVIKTANDIYWLTEEEVTQTAAALDRGRTPEPLVNRIPARQASQRAVSRLAVPFALMKFMGRSLTQFKSGGRRRQKANTLKGVAASPGQVTAPACVLNGPEDFTQMHTGDVLVAAITTPAWTPLFARAAAVVTDVGGPLSHGSIVAREYGIPAVLGTGTATKRIRSGQALTVDGSQGIVIIGNGLEQ